MTWKPASLVLVATLPLSACIGYGLPDARPAQPDVVSLQAQDWYVLHSSGVPEHPTSDPAGAWSVEIPSSQNQGRLCYIETPFRGTGPLHSVSVTFKVESSSPQYVEFDPADELPPTCRLMIEQNNDNGSDPNGRWWAHSSIYNFGSQDGQILSFNIPLDPTLWTNVEGQQNPTAFAAALSNTGWVGVTFGGQRFAGHGFSVTSGSAKYILIGYSVE